MKVYLAGPDIFLPDGAVIGRRKCEMCAAHGLTGLFPLDNEIMADGRERASQRIYRGNSDMMTAAGAIIANLTPFRGPGPDPGTVYELGFMAARGKVCLGYSNGGGDYHGRVAAFRRLYDAAGGNPFDAPGSGVEDFGLPENLMVVHALDEFGHPLVVRDMPEPKRWHDLTGFEICVRWLAERCAADEAKAEQRAR